MFTTDSIHHPQFYSKFYFYTRKTSSTPPGWDHFYCHIHDICDTRPTTIRWQQQGVFDRRSTKSDYFSVISPHFLFFFSSHPQSLLLMSKWHGMMAFALRCIASIHPSSFDCHQSILTLKTIVCREGESDNGGFSVCNC